MFAKLGSLFPMFLKCHVTKQGVTRDFFVVCYPSHKERMSKCQLCASLTSMDEELAMFDEPLSGQTVRNRNGTTRWFPVINYD
jgi:hypothetical protein